MADVTINRSRFGALCGAAESYADVRSRATDGIDAGERLPVRIRRPRRYRESGLGPRESAVGRLEDHRRTSVVKFPDYLGNRFGSGGPAFVARGAIKP